MDSRRRREDNENPIYSRLFIVCDRNETEDRLRDAFSKFGEVEDVMVPQDRTTGKGKGIAFVKFSKTSEAAAAVEQLNNISLPNTTKPIKVNVATPRSEIESDEYDRDKYKRLFIEIPKTTNEDDLYTSFKQFGTVDDIQILKDRNTGEPRGFAYIKFKKFSEAARAFEECAKKYRAIFAQPKHSQRRSETPFESNINELASTSMSINQSLLSYMNVRPGNFTTVNFLCAPFLHYDQVESLFNLIPGMIACEHYVDYNEGCGKGTVSYSSAISASYAVEKLNRFHYPPGALVFVKPCHSRFASNTFNYQRLPNAINKLQNAIKSSKDTGVPDLSMLTEAVAEASALIKKATGGVTDDCIPDSKDLSYCNVTLPPPKPLADINCRTAKRCFLVCKPKPPPQKVLRDVFCRLGDLINVYTLPNKTVGYAQYASEEAADNAMKLLHGAEICGIRIKVLEAEEDTNPKRRRFD